MRFANIEVGAQPKSILMSGQYSVAFKGFAALHRLLSHGPAGHGAVRVNVSMAPPEDPLPGRARDGERRGGHSGIAERECGASLRDHDTCGAAGGIGASTRAEQQQQRQATVQRRAEEAAAGQQSAGTVWQEDRWAEGPSGRDVAPDRNTRYHHRPLSADLHGVRRGVDRGDGDGPCRPAGVRSPRTSDR